MSSVHWRDRPDFWPNAYTPAPEFDRAGYQQKLDDITGLSRERPILRLEWGGEERVARYGALDPGHASPSETVFDPKYKLRKVIHGVQVMVPFKRWVIAQLAEWEEYGYGDDTQTTFTDELGALRRAAEKPRDLYTPLIYVGDHGACREDCCAKKLCPGDYKDPGPEELFWVLEKTYLLKSERVKDPRAREFTPAQMERVTTEQLAKTTAKRKEFNEQLKNI